MVKPPCALEEETTTPILGQPDMPSIEFVARWAVRIHQDTQHTSACDGHVVGWLYYLIVTNQRLRRYMAWHERYTAFLETYGQPLPKDDADNIVTRLSENESLALWRPGEQPGSIVSTPLWQKEAMEDLRQQELMPPGLLRRRGLLPSTKQQITVSDSLCFEPEVFYFFPKPPFLTEIKVLPLTLEERVAQRHLWRTYKILPYTDPEGRLYKIERDGARNNKPARQADLAILDAPWKLHESGRGQKQRPLDVNGYPQQTHQFLRQITTGSSVPDRVAQGSDLKQRVTMALTILATSSPRYMIPIHLHYIEGYSQKDVARQLGIQQSAVSQGVRQGISNLLDICQIYGDRDTDLMKDVLKSLKRAS